MLITFEIALYFKKTSYLTGFSAQNRNVATLRNTSRCGVTSCYLHSKIHIEKYLFEKIIHTALNQTNKKQLKFKLSKAPSKKYSHLLRLNIIH